MIPEVDQNKHHGSKDSIEDQDMSGDDGLETEKPAKGIRVEDFSGEMDVPPPPPPRRDWDFLNVDTMNPEKVDVMEIFSVPRVTTTAKAAGLRAGVALDIEVLNENGEKWDLTRKRMQDEAMNIIDETMPNLVVGSPPCSMFSQIQNINKGKTSTEAWESKMKYAMSMLDFAVKCYFKQLREGRWFLHERPRRARSWRTASMQRLLKRPGVFVVDAHMCEFGLKDVFEEGEMLVKKPTRFLTNSPELAMVLGRRRRDV